MNELLQLPVVFVLAYASISLDSAIHKLEN